MQYIQDVFQFFLTLITNTLNFSSVLIFVLVTFSIAIVLSVFNLLIKGSYKK